jgi:hypothetical protein
MYLLLMKDRHQSNPITLKKIDGPLEHQRLWANFCAGPKSFVSCTLREEDRQGNVNILNENKLLYQ